jgi:undecaprenyl diphosphate synthase
MRKFIKSDLPEFIENGVKLHIIGDWQSLAPDIVEMLGDALEKTSGGRRTLAVALNYGSQQEIVRAARLAAAEGEISNEALDRHLYTSVLPPLDLLIRTSGEVRLSNFLLWQAAYAEMIFTDVLWPDFTPAHLQEALAEFARRERRYGGR